MPNSFSHFRNLPIELRLKIWTWTLPRPRTLHYNNRASQEPDSEVPFVNPIALSVNRESRYLALRYFSPPLDSRRTLLDFKYDYFFISSLPEQGVPRSQWEDRFAADDMEKVCNVILSYPSLESCHLGFRGSLEWYIGNVTPGLKEVVLQFHISERKLRCVVMDGWKKGGWEFDLDAERLRTVLQPIKDFAEGVIKEVLTKRGEASRVIKVSLRECGVCAMCGRLAGCHMAQKAYRAKLKRKKEIEERKSQESRPSETMSAGSSAHVHQAGNSSNHTEPGAGNAQALLEVSWPSSLKGS